MKTIAISMTLDNIKDMWSNGMGQNVLMLKDLIKKMGYNVFLVVDQDFKKNEIDKNIGKVLSYRQMMNLKKFPSLILETGFRFPNQCIKEIRSRKAKIVSIHYGNTYYTDLEGFIFSSGGTQTHTEVERDQCWISPHYEFAKGYMKAIKRGAIIKTIPYIWTPAFIESEMKKNGIKKEDVDYKPGRPVNVGVFEPNISTTKTALIPMSICELAYLKNKSLVNKAYIFNCEDLKKNKSFISLATSMEMARDKKMTFENRLKIITALKNHVSVVLSHQNLNALNYVYLEALYFGYPLIHNSEYFKEFGYYYPGFDAEVGADALKKAINTHDKNLDEYNLKSKEIIWRYSPENPETIKQYAELLAGILGERPSVEITKVKKSKKYSVIMMSYLSDYPSGAKFREQKFIRAVNSFINQSYENKELIIISDGCEKTNTLYEVLYKDNAQIHLIKQPKNTDSKYPGVLRQIGIDHSSGDRIMYLDSDDYYHPERISKIDEQFDDDLDWVCGASSYPTQRKNDDKKLDYQFINEVNTNLKNSVNDYIWCKGTGNLQNRSVGTHSLTHNKDVAGCKWGNFKDGKPEDHSFIDDLLEANLKYKEIDNSTYYICHLTGTYPDTGLRETLFDI